jgi:tRNA dimethylallyltransferase
MEHGRAVLIAGPTASGKSALALALAERLGGMIINADSMQVYDDLRIITARPSPDEEARVPHRLYGHVDAAEDYSVGRWLAEVRPVLAQAGRPILVGGTGLYFKALTRGLAAVPPIPADIRAAVRALGPAALHAELAACDPASAARLNPGDRPRIARALEVMRATGRSLADWHREGLPAALDPGQAVKIFLDPGRDELARKIDARFDSMMTAGALDEVRRLVARGLDPKHPPMLAHGVPWLARSLSGEMPLEAAVKRAKLDTRRYTKRQRTWFRHQLSDFTWVAPADAENLVMAMLRAYTA